MRGLRRWATHPSQRSRHERWLDDLRRDLRYAARHLARTPGLTALVVATLAIGIGANVTMAGVIDRLLLRGPAGVHEPARLVRLLGDTPGAPAPGGWVDYPLVLELAREVRAFAGVAAFTEARLVLGDGADAHEVDAALVSASYFPLLGVRATAGRLFGPGDGFPDGTASGGPPLAVLAHGLWQRQFGGDPTVIGRQVRIGKLTYTVVGVAPRGFRGLGSVAPDVWLPLSVAAEADVRPFALEDRGMSWLTAVARLRPGISRATAEEQATLVWRRSLPPLPMYEATRAVAASVIRGRAPDRPREVNVALWLGGVSALVLLIACANVTNLLLARAFARRREIATRLALGASRERLARQLLTEAALVALLGAASALALTAAGARVVGRYFDADLGGSAFVDLRLLAFAALIALGTSVLIGLAPLVLSALPDLSHVLRGGTTAGGGRNSRARVVLLGAQAAMCMLLLVMAGLFAQSLRRVTGLDLGLEPERTLQVTFSLDHVAMTNEERDATYSLLRERVQAIRGVARIAFVSGGRAVNVHTPTRNADEHIRRTWRVPYEIRVDSGYFRTLGTTMRGRDFTSDDVRGAPKVAIINGPLARLLFPGEEALGQCVYLPIRASDPSGECFTVVGVLQGFYYGGSILLREGLLVYVPMAQREFGLGRPGQMMVVLDAPAGAVIPAVRQAILSVRSDVSRLQIRWMRDVVEPELRPWRLAAAMFSLFGVVALVVATVGLYAMVAFSATQRTHEVAVRLALGAPLLHVLHVVAGEGLRAALVGLAVGTAGALAARRWVGPLLFETSPSDPAVMLAVGMLLAGVTLAAALGPTLRAARQPPASVLRAE